MSATEPTSQRLGINDPRGAQFTNGAPVARKRARAETRRRGACMVTRAEFQGENHLLAALSASDYSLLRPYLKEVRIEQGSVLQEHGERIQYVHFPLSGMISLLSVMRDGKAVETVVVGREGALGAHCAFGIWHAYSRAVVQISGRAVRIAGVQFQKAVRDSERMGDFFLRYRELR